MSAQEYPRGFVHDGSVPSCPAALTRRGKPDMQNVSRISFSVGKAMAVLLISMLWITACHSEPLRGTVGSSSKFYSGWIDLQQLTDFHRDDILKITVDRRIPNPASEIYVRLLPKDGSADDDDEGAGIYRVTGPVVEIKLDKDYSQIRQISIHGGPNPFGAHQLPPDNGRAKLISVDLIAAATRRWEREAYPVDDIAISWLKSITDVNVDTWLGVLGGATAIGGIAQGFLPKERLSGYTIIIIATIAGLLFSSIVIYRHREHEERIHFLARTFV
jgi:hypothetical protein